MKKINNSARYGSFSLITTAIVLVILILVNLAIGSLPASVTSIAGEKANLYKISKASVNYLEDLDEKITVYIVQIEGASSEHDLMIKKYVERYVELSDKVTLKYVDPEIKPAFLSSYNKDGALTEDQLSSEFTHLVVESGKRARIIPYSDIFKYALSGDDLNAFYQVYGYIPYSYNIENCLLSAIDYVTLDVLPTIYYTNTHKEAALDDGFSAFAKLENIGISAIDLEKTGKVPDDAQAIIVYAPETDFSAKEIEALKAYADKGGNIILSTDYNINSTDRVLDNLYGFASEYYGLSYLDVIVLEGSTTNYYGYPTFIFTTMTDKVPSVIKTGQQGYVLFTYCHAIGISKTLPEGVTVDTLFTTTSKGYAKTSYDKDFTYDKKDGDLEGSFVLGAISTRGNGENASRLWWFSSTDAISTSRNPYVAVYALTESVDKEDSVSAASIIITHDRLDISDKAATMWSWIIIAVIPGAILAYGIYIRVRRARR